ncbi:MAG TPA: LLM class flavin-dependent oxidoreductase, partial [Usitatibacter sp.]|nr:LLM class flavin-dependent oxidoreductase [Usitatibacter sp.]
VPVRSDQTTGDALRASLELARTADAHGCRRYWVAEHHNMPAVASTNPPVIIAMLAAATSRIRIGSGGVMLPNHAPLVVAEQVGTLETIYPGRVDLGLGRAPGTDPLTMRALRRHSTGADFDLDVAELLSYFAPARPGQAVRAIPGAGIDVPVWILGSSLYSAHLAAKIGRPYAFASHFAPGDLLQALEIYRGEFRPSPQLAEPRVMVGVPLVAADDDIEAERLATTMFLRTLGILRGQRAGLQPPVESMEGLWTAGEQLAVAERMALMVVGGPERVREGLRQIVDATQADELILVSETWDRRARLRSFEIVAQLAGKAPA